MDKKRVLIIDDEENFCKLLKKNIEQNGEFEVYTANSGEEGISLAKKVKPGLILLDVVMPEMDGGDVISLLQNDEETGDIPVVFLTAIVREEEVSGQPNFFKGYSFLAKTVTVGELMACIKKNIR